MAEQIIPEQITVGDELQIIQDFGGGEKRLWQGFVIYYEDEYVMLDTTKPQELNLHPHVGMPNVTIWRLS